ncbi:MAG: hypothetical protein AB7E21_08000 [Pseudodonghicola sp.]
MRVTSSPAISTAPEVAGIEPVRACTKEVLPAPFGPMIAWRAPGCRLSDTRSTAAKEPKREVGIIQRIGAAPRTAAQLLTAEIAAGARHRAGGVV